MHPREHVLSLSDLFAATLTTADATTLTAAGASKAGRDSNPASRYRGSFINAYHALSFLCSRDYTLGVRKKT